MKHVINVVAGSGKSGSANSGKGRIRYDEVGVPVASAVPSASPFAVFVVAAVAIVATVGVVLAVRVRRVRSDEDAAPVETDL